MSVEEGERKMVSIDGYKREEGREEEGQLICLLHYVCGIGCWGLVKNLLIVCPSMGENRGFSRLARMVPGMGCDKLG